MATIAAAAIAAAGAIGGGVLASQGAKSAAKAGRGKPQQVPLPRYADALNRYTARLIAENATSVPPTFGDWLASGGRATFPLRDTGFTPQEAVNLGAVDQAGRPVPFVSPGASRLTPEQVLFMGRQQRAQGKGTLASRYAGIVDLLNRLEGMKQTGPRQRKEQRLTAREDILKKELGI